MQESKEEGKLFFNSQEVKLIKDFPNYGVTDNGDVISFIGKHPKRLKLNPGSINYYTVFLRRDNKTFTKYVHRLVLETYNPLDSIDNLEIKKLECEHINNDTHDNRLSNLRWTTRNINTAKGMITSGRKQFLAKAVVSINEYGEVVNKYPTMGLAAEANKTSLSAIRKSCSMDNKYLLAGGYAWVWLEDFYKLGLDNKTAEELIDWLVNDKYSGVNPFIKHNAKIVECLNEGGDVIYTFKSATDAAIYFKVSKSRIQNYCNMYSMKRTMMGYYLRYK